MNARNATRQLGQVSAWTGADDLPIPYALTLLAFAVAGDATRRRAVAR